MANRRSRSYSYTPRSLKHQEDKTKKRLIWYLGSALLIVVLFFLYGLPLTIRTLSLFSKSKAPLKIASEYSELTPPVFNIPFEATGSAIINVRGYGQPNTKIEIYLNNEKVSDVTPQDDGSFNVNDLGLNDGENYLYGKTTDSNGHTSLDSKTIKIIYSKDKPSLEIEEPSDDKTITGGDKKVMVKGTTDTENTIRINGSIIIVQPSGSFQREISLQDGVNEITIEAINKVGNINSVTKKVTYNPN